MEVLAYGWMGPFFFLELGSTIAVDMEMLAGVAVYVLVFYVLLFVGQFISAAGAAMYVPGGFDLPDSIMIGFGMMGRAELFFVVLELCYVQYHIMTREQLCTFAFVAMLMNISVPVCITLYKPYYVKMKRKIDPDFKVVMPGDEDDSHGHDESHGKGENQDGSLDGMNRDDLIARIKQLEASPAGAPKYSEDTATTTTYGDARLKDLDGVHVNVGMDTPRSVEDDESYIESRDHSSKPFKPNNRAAFIPSLCGGCMSSDTAHAPIDNRHRR